MFNSNMKNSFRAAGASLLDDRSMHSQNVL
jgi:hypothetical protein